MPKEAEKIFTTIQNFILISHLLLNQILLVYFEVGFKQNSFRSLSNIYKLLRPSMYMHDMEATAWTVSVEP